MLGDGDGHGGVMTCDMIAIARLRILEMFHGEWKVLISSKQSTEKAKRESHVHNFNFSFKRTKDITYCEEVLQLIGVAGSQVLIIFLKRKETVGTTQRFAAAPEKKPRCNALTTPGYLHISALLSVLLDVNLGHRYISILQFRLH